MPANDVIVASTAADAEAVEAVKSHHAHLAGRVALLAEAMLSAAERGVDYEQRGPEAWRLRLTKR